MVQWLVAASVMLVGFALPRKWLLSAFIPAAACLPPNANINLGPTSVAPVYIVVACCAIRLIGDVNPSLPLAPAALKLPRLGPGVVFTIATIYITVNVLAFGIRIGGSTSLQNITVGLFLTSGIYASGIRNTLVSFNLIRGTLSIIELVNVALAILERLSAQYVLPAGAGVFHPILRSGEVRGQGLFPHPIVFALFCAGVGAMWIFDHTRWVWKISFLALSIAGLVVSDSRGPVIALASAVIVGIVANLIRRPGVRFVVFAFVIWAGVALTSSIGFQEGSVYIGGSTEAAASTAYRIALLQVGVQAVWAHPFGFGPGGTPAGLLLVPSEYGTLDLARSVDNTLLALALEYGLPLVASMLIAFALVMARALSLAGARPITAPAAALITVVIGGLSVSLFSWTCLCIVIAVVGAAAASRTEIVSTLDRPVLPRRSSNTGTEQFRN